MKLLAAIAAVATLAALSGCAHYNPNWGTQAEWMALAGAMNQQAYRQQQMNAYRQQQLMQQHLWHQQMHQQPAHDPFAQQRAYEQQFQMNRINQNLEGLRYGY